MKTENTGPKTMDREEAESIVSIDTLQLEKECVKLPRDLVRHAFAAAEARRDVDELKAELDVVEADLGKRIRNTPNQFGLEKVTESALSATVLLQEEYQRALKKVQRRRYDLELLQAVVAALEVKKRSITLLVELHSMAYFGTPKVSNAGKETLKGMMEKRFSNRREHSSRED
jgi:hypothetical protein